MTHDTEVQVHDPDPPRALVLYVRLATKQTHSYSRVQGPSRPHCNFAESLGERSVILDVCRENHAIMWSHYGEYCIT